ncbi:MAG: hypothetical protein LBQ54_07090 [Planctomycetaceae bacterium]|nr:hypothetical protein [Planctomycetaceae bacterium]
MKNARVILGVHVNSFASKSGEVQKTLTEYGCDIRTRLGLHDVAEGVCSPYATILIEFIGGEAKAEELTKKLTAIDGVEVKKMVFGSECGCGCGK